MYNLIALLIPVAIIALLIPWQSVIVPNSRLLPKRGRHAR